MSARYQLRKVGVFDTTTGKEVHRRDPEWGAYEAWLTAGNVPDSQPAPPQRPIEERRREVSARINEVRSRVLDRLTVQIGGYTFDAGNASYANLLGVGVLLLSGEPLPVGFTWRTAGNILVPLTAIQVRGLVKLMVQAREAAFRRAWTLKDAEVATSNDPESINIEAGWPS